MQKIFFPSSRARFINKEEIIKAVRKEAIKIAKQNSRIDSVYLFGSYAQDAPSFRSDVDLLIILKEDSRCMLDRVEEYLLKFSDCPVPVDVLVYTEEEIKKAIENGSSFMKRACGGIKLV